MKCEICEIIKGKLGMIYEDDDIFAYISPNPARPGHIILTTKQHLPIFEQVPKEMIPKLFTTANKISMLIFEKLGAKGTNILVNNGISAGQFHPHFSINIIPRNEDDGLNLTWDTKKLTTEEISEIELLYNNPDSKNEENNTDRPIEVTQKSADEKEINYLYKQIERIP